MKVDFTIDELEHIRYAISKIKVNPKGTNDSIHRKVNAIIDPIRLKEAKYTTQLGSPRKPVN